MNVLWTDESSRNLKDIYDYFFEKASKTVAVKLAQTLVDVTISLETNPEMGQVEELLKDRTREYRYLVEGNYKLIYWIEINNVFIACVFDTRQNPQKLVGMIK